MSSYTGVLILIDPDWLDIKDDQGNRRLDNPDDWVRLEIEAAFARNVPILPLLLRGAQMPAADKVPPSLRRLTETNAVALGDENLWTDLWSSVDSLTSSADRPRQQFLGRAAKSRHDQFADLVRMYRTEVEDKSSLVSLIPWRQTDAIRPLLEAVLDNLTTDEEVIDLALALSNESPVLLGLAVLTNQRVLYSPRSAPAKLTSVRISEVINVRRGLINRSVKLVLPEDNFELSSMVPPAKARTFANYLQDRLAH
jgi:hypothetical protein